MDAIQSAFEKVKGELLSGTWRQRERLPSLAQLAQRCSVSRTTMWRALKLLKKEQLLHAKKRGAIIAGPAGVAAAGPLPAGKAWERLTRRIHQDLISGAFSGKNLPPINKLSLNYNAAIDTVRKSLNSLAHEGILSHTGRAYCAVQNSSHKLALTVVLIAAESSEQGAFMLDARLLKLSESLERDCAARGFDYRYEGLVQRTPNGLLTFTEEIKSISRLAGCIVSLWNPRSDAFWKRWLDALAFLISRDVPVVVIDQEGDLAFPEALIRCKNLRILRIVGEKAGKTVAESLLRRGCRNVAYIAPLFGPSWARNRYAGLCRCFSQFGGRHSSVTLFSLSETIEINALTMALLGIDKKDLAVLYRERLSPKQIEDLAAEVDLAAREKLSEKTGSGPIAATVHAATQFLISLAGKEHERIVYDTMLGALLQVASNNAMESYLTPLFEQAIKASPGSTWVCSDDKTALIALSYLENSGKRVPQDISVIGFENWRESAERHLSTFDFNMNGMAEQALLLIMDNKSLKSQPAISEVNGYVVERRTTLRKYLDTQRQLSMDFRR